MDISTLLETPSKFIEKFRECQEKLDDYEF